MIANQSGMDYYLVKVQEEYTDDNGKVKYNKFNVLVHAYSVTEAEAITIQEYGTGGTPIEVVGATKTRILDVLEKKNATAPAGFA